MLGNITCGGKLIAFPVDPEAHVRKVGGDQSKLSRSFAGTLPPKTAFALL